MQTKSHTIRAIYKDYDENTEDKIDYRVFADICSEFNIAIFDELLNGYEFNLQNNLGTVSVRRVERDPRKPQIDWGETTKYKRELLDKGVELSDCRTGEGEKWHIYYKDKFYCKFHWTKIRAKINNNTAKRFDATNSFKCKNEKKNEIL